MHDEDVKGDTKYRK